MTETQTDLASVVASYWWVPLLRGILLILFALLIIAQPGATLLTLIYFLGFYWLVGGIFSIVEGLAGKGFGSTPWMIITGILELLAGIFIIGNPLVAGQISALLIVYAIGALTIMAGLTMAINGFGIKQAWGRVVLGFLYIVFGIIIMYNPVESVTSLIWLIPLWAIMSGVLAIFLSFQVRSLSNK